MTGWRKREASQGHAPSDSGISGDLCLLVTPVLVLSGCLVLAAPDRGPFSPKSQKTNWKEPSRHHLRPIRLMKALPRLKELNGLWIQGQSLSVLIEFFFPPFLFLIIFSISLLASSGFCCQTCFGRRLFPPSSDDSTLLLLCSFFTESNQK